MSNIDSTKERQSLEKEITALKAKGPGTLDDRLKLRGLLKRFDRLDALISSRSLINRGEKK